MTTRSSDDPTDRLAQARSALGLASERAPLASKTRSLVTMASWGTAAAGFLAIAASFALLVGTPERHNLRADSSSLTVSAGIAEPAQVERLTALTFVADPPPTVASAIGPAIGPVVGPVVASGAAPDMAVQTVGVDARPLVLLVIDDLGLDERAAARVAALDAPVVAAILPYAPRAARLSVQMQAAGHAVFVHLPMEPEGLEDPGPGALTTWMSEDEMRERADAAFDAVPGALGFNNHMGSRMTECGACLRPVLDSAKARGLVALDSLTSAQSTLAAQARSVGLSVLVRDVFLDNQIEARAIAARIAEAETRARERGSVIVIAHPHAASLDAIEAWIEQGSARAVRFATLSELAQVPPAATVTADAAG